MGALSRAFTWVKPLFGLEPKVIRRTPPGRHHSGDMPAAQVRTRTPAGPTQIGAGSPPVTSDEVGICIEDLSMWVRSSSDLEVPYELTVVVPRAEITRRYVDGRLAEVVSTYSSITIARSPRLPERNPRP